MKRPRSNGQPPGEVSQTRALIRKLIQQHGWAVEASTEPGQLLVFPDAGRSITGKRKLTVAEPKNSSGEVVDNLIRFPLAVRAASSTEP